jgi:hypothetical protein
MITFGDLITPAKDCAFFADTPLMKSGIAAVGVMAKRGNWYPLEHMRAASRFILDKIGGYKTRITYGGSMGGYAAVKFSGLLGASHVLSMCPQWSIDPAECQGVDSGWRDHFLPAMCGMGIRARDVAGEVFLFADAYHGSDMFHCRKIIENCPNSHFINVPMVGHHVTTVFAGTGNLLHLIDACRGCNTNSLRGFSRRTRKRHPIWLGGIQRYALQKLPRLGIHLLVDASPDLLRENWRHFPHVLSHLATAVGVGRAVVFYEKFWSVLPGPVEQQLMCAYLIALTGGRVAIATDHGSYLIYNLSENSVLHKGAPLDPWEIPVEAKHLDSIAALFVKVGGNEFLLSVDDTGRLIVPTTKGRRKEEFSFEFNLGENGKFTISHGEQYLSAEQGGARVICNRDKAQDWEKFRFTAL